MIMEASGSKDLPGDLLTWKQIRRKRTWPLFSFSCTYSSTGWKETAEDQERILHKEICPQDMITCF
jgi:hypothetical protein